MNRPNTQNDKQATVTFPASESALARATNFPETTFNGSQAALFGEDELVSSLSNAYENRATKTQANDAKSPVVRTRPLCPYPQGQGQYG